MDLGYDVGMYANIHCDSDVHIIVLKNKFF